MKKIKFTIPYFNYEKIKEDEAHFKLKPGEIGNRIFWYYANKKVEMIEAKSNKGESIQFNLNTKNEELYYAVLKDHGAQNEAEFWRILVFNYLNNPKHIREEILYQNIFNEARAAIKNEKIIRIKYKGEFRDVHLYFIKTAAGEDRSYLFCYCTKHEAHRNYRIASINNIFVSRNNVEFYDQAYIDGVEKNFDPFLSYGRKIVITFTEKGKELFGRVTYNRPKLLEQKDEKYIFQCTNKHAKVYFPQFMSEIEILEPENLRKWYMEELEKALSLYKK